MLNKILSESESESVWVYGGPLLGLCWLIDSFE